MDFDPKDSRLGFFVAFFLLYYGIVQILNFEKKLKSLKKKIEKILELDCFVDLMMSEDLFLLF